jgi:type VI secretion system protein
MRPSSTSTGPGALARRRGLLGRLAGKADRKDEQASVLAHLQALLNTRTGESFAAPDLGLVDFADVVHGFPASAQVLVQGIRAMILAYEPRLRSVQVRPIASADALALAFEISARFVAGRGQLRLRTELTSSGHFEMRED